VPNLLDELDLSPLAFRLYFSYLRWEGANRKHCPSVRTLTKKFKVGDRKLAAARKELVDANLMKFEKDPENRRSPLKPVVLDAWKRNLDFF
jgi:DNA-binding MarR family transcriptional regulator